MSITAICPHCESKYTLQPDLLGKPMRCPNPDCREVFVVADAAPPATLEAPPTERPAPVVFEEPAPTVISGRVEDMLPVLNVTPEREPAPTLESFRLPEPSSQDLVVPEVLVADDDRLTTVRRLPPPAPPTLARTVAPVFDAEAVDGPKEVVWSDRDSAPTTAATATLDPDELADDDIFAKRRGKRKQWIWVAVLGGLIFALIGVMVTIGVQSILNELRREEQLATEAKEAFDNQKYTDAVQKYDLLQKDFPTSDKIETYQFFGELSGLHVAVDTAGPTKPADGTTAFNEFVKKHEESPLIRPDETGQGYFVFEAGRKLTTNIVEHAKEKLNSYVRNRKKNGADLTTAEDAVKAGLPLLPVVERYRIKDVTALDEQRKSMDELTGKFARERERLVVLAPFRGLPDDPSDERIAMFVVALKQTGFEQDGEALGILELSKLNLRKLIKTVVSERAPAAVPADAAPALLFIAPPHGEKPPPPGQIPVDAVPETFFAAVRGILYAFDVDTGNFLWATRVGSQASGAGGDDVPVRVSLGAGGTDLAIVSSDVGGKPGLTARVARTGEAVWYQPLEAAAAGRPVAVGSRLYVSLRDPVGTLVEFEYATGNRLAQMTFRQRLGAGAVNQKGTSLLYVPGEGRRVFVIDVAPVDVAGDRLPMRCLTVLTTDHPDRSLRVAPVISGPAGDSIAPRFLVLAQAEGTLNTRVRAFALDPPNRALKADEAPPERTPTSGGSALLSGHVTFPPAADGERVAVVTDAGAFALFGTNQLGNQDVGLFPLPVTLQPGDPKKPIPGQVVFADEDEFWALCRGGLVRMRLGLTADVGLRVQDVKPSRPVGVPLHRSQWNSRRDFALAVVRSDESDGARAVAFDPRDGRIRWQRKLGAVPPAGPFPRADGSAIVVDEDGGVYSLPPDAAGVADVGTRPVQPGWVVARPSGITAAPPRAAADAENVWVLIPEQPENTKQLRVRQIAGGKVVTETTVPLPYLPVGDPVVVGGSVAVPLSDGFVYRFDAAANKLALGPQWRGDGAAADAVCYLTAAGADEFVGSDGGKRVNRWRWPTGAGTDWKTVAGPWEARDKVAFAPVVLTLGETARRLAVADVAGNVWLFDADRTGDAVRRWRPTAEGPIPQGRPFGGFALPVVEGKMRLVYATAGNSLVCLSPEDEKPLWVVRGKDDAADLLGCSAVGSAVVATDVSGVLTGYAADGKKLGESKPAVPDLFPRTRAVPFGPDRVLLIEWDGSAVFLPTPAK